MACYIYDVFKTNGHYVFLSSGKAQQPAMLTKLNL